MIDTLEKKINGQTHVLNSKQNQNFGTILHNCVSSVIWTWFFYFLGIVRIVTNQHFMLECKVEVDDCRLFPQQGDMELTEDDRNNLSEMDNEFGEELNDEWGMENLEEFQGQTKCNSSISSQGQRILNYCNQCCFLRKHYASSRCILRSEIDYSSRGHPFFLLGIDQHLIKNQFLL